MEQVNTVSTTATAHPTMNWGAILAGWVVAAGIAEVLFVGGLALGFSVLDAPNDGATGSIGAGIAAWVVLTWAAAMFVGGMFASWFDGKNDTTMGTMHGVTVWGLSVVTSGLMLFPGLGQTLHASTAYHASTIFGLGALSLLVGLVFSALGGWAGANHIHRVYHLRTYIRQA